MAQGQAGLLRFLSLLMVALAGLGGCAGGPHPEPPDMLHTAGGTGGSPSTSVDAGMVSHGSGGMGAQTGGNSGAGSGGTFAGSGGSSGGAGSGAQDGGGSACDRDTDDMDAGTACIVDGGDDDAGALR